MVRLMTHDTYNDGPICSLTELPQAWCGHCRDAARRRTWRAAQEGGDTTTRFTARYGGVCAACGEPFPEGSWIGVTLDEEYICESCAQ